MNAHISYVTTITRTNNIQGSASSLSLSPPQPPTQAQEVMIDAGSDGAYFTSSYTLENKSPSNLSIVLPDSSKLLAEHKGTLRLRHIAKPITVHGFKGLSRNLMPHSVWTNNGFKVQYDGEEVIAICKLTGRSHKIGSTRLGKLSFLELEIIEDEEKEEEEQESDAVIVHQANMVTRTSLKSVKSQCQYFYRKLGSPSLSALGNAVEKGWIKLDFNLTMQQMRKHIDVNDHIRLTGVMKKPATNKSMHKGTKASKGETENSGEAGEEEDFTSMKDFYQGGVLWNDQSGALPIEGLKNETMIDLHYDSKTGFIFSTPIEQAKEAVQLKSWTNTLDYLEENGNVLAKNAVMDALASKKLKKHLKERGLVTTTVTTHTKHHNAAERMMDLVKGTTTKLLSAIEEDAPAAIYSESKQMADIVNNVLRPSADDPSMSAWAAAHNGVEYDARKHPFEVFGALVSVFENRDQRGAWGTRAKLGYYLGPDLDHLKGHKVFMIDTKDTRVVANVAVHPSARFYPISISDDVYLADAITTATDVISVLASKKKNKPLLSENLKLLANVLKQVQDELVVPPIVAMELSEQPAMPQVPSADFARSNPPPGIPQRVEENEAASQRVQEQPKKQETYDWLPDFEGMHAAQEEKDDEEEVRGRQTPMSEAQAPAPANKQEEEQKEILWICCTACGKWRTAPWTMDASSLPEKWYCNMNTWSAQNTCAAPEEAVLTEPLAKRGPAALNQIYSSKDKKARKDNKEYNKRNNLGPSPRSSRTKWAKEGQAQAAKNQANAVSIGANSIKAPLSAQMRTAHALRLPGRQEQVERSIMDELELIIDSPAKCVRFVNWSTKPKGSQLHRVSLVTKFSEAKVPLTGPNAAAEQELEKCRTRLTADSSSNPYVGEGSTTAFVADLETVKIMLNMVASNKHRRCSKADIGSFFPVTPLDKGEKEYMALPLKLLPVQAISKYGLEKLAVNGTVLIESFNAIYGLRQSGKRAGDAVEAHMASNGWKSEPATPCIYANENVPGVAIARIVDDFFVTHEEDKEFMDFVTMLKKLYDTVVYELDCKQFCGLDIAIRNFGTDMKEVHVSVNGYVEEALLQVNYTPSKLIQDSPGAWSRPQYGYTEQSETIVDSPPLVPYAVF